jgi:hypothetical protein
MADKVIVEGLPMTTEAHPPGAKIIRVINHRFYGYCQDEELLPRPVRRTVDQQ